MCVWFQVTLIVVITLVVITDEQNDENAVVYWVAWMHASDFFLHGKYTTIKRGSHFLAILILENCFGNLEKVSVLAEWRHGCCVLIALWTGDDASHKYRTCWWRNWDDISMLGILKFDVSTFTWKNHCNGFNTIFIALP